MEDGLREAIAGAEAYESLHVPSLFEEWAPRVLDSVDVGAGHSVLDVACGTGILARTAMDRVGPSGSVVGVDPNPGMLAVAKGLGARIDWRSGTAEEATPVRRHVPMKLPLALGFHVLAALLLTAAPVLAQGTEAERRQARAVAEAALDAVTAEDVVALTDLMVDEALVFTVSGTGQDVRHSIRTRAEQRRRGFSGDIVERGFDAEVRIAAGLATVWLPYDLYVNGSWSHCGVDVFTLLRVEGEWRILTMGWTVEQPPACRRHPNGPPTG